MQKKQFITTYFLIPIFLFVGLFGLSISANHITHNGQMLGCPFMGMGEVMTVYEHIAKWQHILTGIQAKGLVFALFVAFAFFFLLRKKLLLLPSNIGVQKLALYYKYNPDTKLYNPLILAFAQGILHPKIYNPAIL